jgi:RimJ/RimL family protein N-acetyltransferase/catechol 2,3-dioxygenase-like lactoylglutathione lyase family enzyme
MPFELQPTLVGSLLELRPLRPEDWEALYAVASDPLIWEQHPDNERYKEAVFRDFFRGALESGGALVAIDRRDGRIVGSSRYAEYDEARSEIEIGWTFLARSYWGGRYNGEMKRLMLDHAFRFVDSVVFVIGPKNVRSQRAIEKIGGVLAGTNLARGRENLVYRIVRPLPARIVSIEHVQLAMPRGEEDKARGFYSGLLGLPEVAKPAELAKRGGVWFERGAVKVHLGVEAEFRAAKKAHPAFLVHDLEGLVQRLREAGVEVVDDGLLPGYGRVYVADPFGNRLELMERIGENRHD